MLILPSWTLYMCYAIWNWNLCRDFSKPNMEVCTCLGDATIEVACIVWMPLVKCFQIAILKGLYIAVRISTRVVSVNVMLITWHWLISLNATVSACHKMEFYPHRVSDRSFVEALRCMLIKGPVLLNFPCLWINLWKWLPAYRPVALQPNGSFWWDPWHRPTILHHNTSQHQEWQPVVP